MSEHYEQNNYQEDKEQLIFETTTDGRDKSKQLIEILGNNDIFLKNAAVLSLDVELGGEIMFAEIPNVSNLTATEPNHPNGDIPDYADEDDPLHAVPVH